jgi:hypothetical protein
LSPRGKECGFWIDIWALVTLYEALVGRCDFSCVPNIMFQMVKNCAYKNFFTHKMVSFLIDPSISAFFCCFTVPRNNLYQEEKKIQNFIRVVSARKNRKAKKNFY